MERKNVGVGVGVILLKDKKILLGKRSEDATKADSELHGEGKWTLPGGKLHFQESFENAAKREVLEETGIKVDKVKVICVSNDIVKDAHFVTIGMMSSDFEGEAKTMEPNEITGWKWFALDNLPKPMFFPSERIIKNFLKGKFYRSEE